MNIIQIAKITFIGRDQARDIAYDFNTTAHVVVFDAAGARSLADIIVSGQDIHVRLTLTPVIPAVGNTFGDLTEHWPPNIER